MTTHLPHSPDHPVPYVSPPGAFRIRRADHAAALKNLQRGCSQHTVIADYLKSPEEFARTSYLARALELLGMQCDVDGGDLVLVPFEGGEGVDLSAYYWDFIETLVHEEHPGSLSEGSKLAMIEAGMAVDGDDGVGEEDGAPASDAAEAFMEEMAEREITGEELDALIASEGTVDFCNSDGKTPWLAACEDYRWAIAEHADAQLASDEANDRRDDGDESSDDDREDAQQALTEAAAVLQARLHNLQIVLQRQPDLAACTPDGMDAMAYAAQSGQLEWVDWLLAHGAQVRPRTLQEALQSFSVDMVRKLAHANPHAVEPDLLVRASAAPCVMPGKVELVRYLVKDLGCNVNARTAAVIYEGKGRVGRLGTPLMAAALADDLAVVEYLLTAGADVHAVDAYGNTALHYCSGQTWVSDGGPLWFALDDNPSVIALLRQHGANDGAQNIAGVTPRDLLARRDE